MVCLLWQMQGITVIIIEFSLFHPSFTVEQKLVHCVLLPLVMGLKLEYLWGDFDNTLTFSFSQKDHLHYADENVPALVSGSTERRIKQNNTVTPHTSCFVLYPCK